MQSGPDRGPIVRGATPATHINYSSTPVFLSKRIATVSRAKLGDASLVQLKLSGPDSVGPRSGRDGAIGADRAQTVQSGVPRPRPGLGEPRKPFSRNFRGAQRETLLEPFLRAAP